MRNLADTLRHANPVALYALAILTLVLAVLAVLAVIIVGRLV